MNELRNQTISKLPTKAFTPKAEGRREGLGYEWKDFKTHECFVGEKSQSE